MRRLLLATAFALSLPLAHANDLHITNAGFEEEFAEDGTFRILTPFGWSLYDPNGINDSGADVIGVLNPTGTAFFPGGAPEGRNAALVYVADDIGGGPMGLVQEIDYSLQVGNTYTLRVAVGNIASGTDTGPSPAFYDLDGFPGYAVQLLAGGVVVAEDLNTLANIPEGTFAESVVTLSVDENHPQLNGTLAIRLLNLTQPGTPGAPGIEVDFDNVRLTAVPTVPEPSTWAMAIAGGLCLLAMMRARLRRVPVTPSSPRATAGRARGAGPTGR